MPLSTNFTDEQVDYIREICHIPNTDDRIAILVGKLDAFNAAQVARTVNDITRWMAMEYGTERSKGGIKGTDFSMERNRDQITNKVRERLAYPLLPATAGNPDALAVINLNLPSWTGGSPYDEFSRDGDFDDRIF